MNLTQLHTVVDAHFRRRASTYALDASALQVTYVLNWGGFVNHSFRLSDGRTEFHLKLATSGSGERALRRWHDLDPMLQKYHAPPVLAWIELDGASGLLFPVVRGASPSLSHDVLHEVTRVLAHLWQDGALALALRPALHASAADYYFGTYDERFMADLSYIRGAKPDFLSSATLDYLEQEARGLADTVRSAAAFQEELRSPVHGDLWLNNVLWEHATSWHLLDWDDLAIGDPAADLAMLTGPTAEDLTPLKCFDEISDGLSDAVRQRLLLLGRASLLDWAIDPLSDWIDATTAAEHAQHVRAEKERMSTEALALYRALYDDA